MSDVFSRIPTYMFPLGTSRFSVTNSRGETHASTVHRDIDSLDIPLGEGQDSISLHSVDREPGVVSIRVPGQSRPENGTVLEADDGSVHIFSFGGPEIDMESTPDGGTDDATQIHVRSRPDQPAMDYTFTRSK